MILQSTMLRKTSGWAVKKAKDGGRSVSLPLLTRDTKPAEDPMYYSSDETRTYRAVSVLASG